MRRRLNRARAPSPCHSLASRAHLSSFKIHEGFSRSSFPLQMLLVCLKYDVSRAGLDGTAVYLFLPATDILIQYGNGDTEISPHFSPPCPTFDDATHDATYGGCRADVMLECPACFDEFRLVFTRNLRSEGGTHTPSQAFFQAFCVLVRPKWWRRCASAASTSASRALRNKCACSRGRWLGWDMLCCKMILYAVTIIWV